MFVKKSDIRNSATSSPPTSIKKAAKRICRP